MPEVLKAAEVDGKPSHDDLRQMINYALTGGSEVWSGDHPFIVEMGEESCIIRNSGKDWRYPYTVANGKATLGVPTPVKLSWQDAKGTVEANDANRGSMAFVVDLAGLQFAEGAETVPIQVCKDGKWSHPKFGEIQVDASTRKAFVDNFTGNVRKCGDLPLDYDHQPGPAPGWIVGLRNEGEALFADVKLTPSGTEKVRSGEYRFFSPEWHPDWQDPETGKSYGPTLFGGGLTNRPFFRGMAAINCDEFGGQTPATTPPHPAEEGTPTMSDPTQGAGTGVEPPAMTAAEVQKLSERLTAVECENAALRAAEERRGVTDAVSALKFSEKRVILAPASKATLVDELMKVPAANREAILGAVKGLQFAELGERGFTPAEEADATTLTASEESNLQALAKRNNLKFEDLKANFLTARAERTGTVTAAA